MIISDPVFLEDTSGRQSQDDNAKKRGPSLVLEIMSSEFYLSGRESDLELGFASLFGDLRLDSPPNIYLHGFVGTATAMNLTDSVSSEFYLSGRESDLELGFASLFGDLRLDSPPNIYLHGFVGTATAMNLTDSGFLELLATYKGWAAQYF
ncbi:Hypp6901 [Branchiostoma lanceolatum]|uniref:Hypp6901 protein n=1 Tax=Branchiostoma lanceolatum TaxID=7740 RepID=A0A8J9YVT8_BRALA|nr:Hypp6901 [Branchiostoma lanceolatum]